LMVVDRRHTVLGSFNLNYRSFLHDLEAAVVLADEALAESIWQRVFVPYLAMSHRLEAGSQPAMLRNPLNRILQPFT